MTAITAAQGNITAQDVDAIVNAANVDLRHGGGVAAAISKAGGPVIQEASDQWVREHGPLSPGVAAITPAGDMPAQVVVHVAGPVFAPSQDNSGLLRKAVVAALDAAASVGCRSVAMPAISAGIYGYPPAEATAVIALAAQGWSLEHPDSLDEIRLIGFSDEIASQFASALEG